MPEKPHVLVGRPVDETWEAYRDFITAVCEHLGVPVQARTAEEWRAKAAAFWAKAKAAAADA
jgi:hypothetical protein